MKRLLCVCFAAAMLVVAIVCLSVALVRGAAAQAWPPSNAVIDYRQIYTGASLQTVVRKAESHAMGKMMPAKLRFDAKAVEKANPALAAELRRMAVYIEGTDPASWYLPVMGCQPGTAC